MPVVQTELYMFIELELYSEKQLNGIKILSYFFLSRKYTSIEICLYLIGQVLSRCNFSGRKMQSVFHWLQHRTVSYVLNLYNKTSYKIKNAFKPIFSLHTCTGKRLYNHTSYNICNNNEATPTAGISLMIKLDGSKQKP